MPRTLLQLPVRVRGRNLVGEALVTNGSLSGVFIEGVLGAETGEMLLLSCALPDGSLVELDGVVVRSDAFGCGVRLVRSAPRYAQYIEFLTDV